MAWQSFLYPSTIEAGRKERQMPCMMKIRRFCMASGGSKHDPEKCAAVFGSDHAKSNNESVATFRRKSSRSAASKIIQDWRQRP
jgi:hypothetical protein